MRSQDQREYEKLIIVSGTDWAPDEEEFHTSPQAPPGQMVFLCAVCVWPGSECSQVLANICSPLHNGCHSSRSSAGVGTGGVHAQPDLGHPTADRRGVVSGATVGVQGSMVLSAGTHGITGDFKEYQGDSSVPRHLAARFHRNRLAPTAAG